MAAWIASALCALFILKPQEWIPALHGVPLLHLALGIMVICTAIERARQRLRPALGPQVRYALGFLLCALVSTAVRSPEVLWDRIQQLIPLVSVFLAVAVAGASTRGLRAFALTFVGCAVFVTGVALVQGHQPFECVLRAPDDFDATGELTPDGRPCEIRADCRVDAPVPDGAYLCERVGPLATTTITGRVRFRGALADPNELSLMAAMAIPFAIAVFEWRRAQRSPRGGGRFSLVAGVATLLQALSVSGLLGVVGLMIVMARSRAGLIVFLVVVGLNLLRWRRRVGLLGTCLIALPMLLFGGRSGDEADASMHERLNLLREGFEMIRLSKGFGVGIGRFVDESSTGQTAHNSYLLAIAESGAIGLCLFTLLLYSSLKVALAIWRGEYKVDAVVSRFAPAVFVSLCGALAGIFFLSWSYKDVLYMVLGASSALYGAARAQDPRVSVRLSAKEVVLVCGGMFTLLVAVSLAIRNMD